MSDTNDDRYTITCPVCGGDSGLPSPGVSIWSLYEGNPLKCSACGALVDAYADSDGDEDWVGLERHMDGQHER